MKKMLTKPAMSCMVIAALLLGSAHAQPAEAVDKPAKVAVKKKKKTAKAAKPAASSASRVKFLPGSQETPSERRARLLRECKDGVNAGVCQGYTR
jgi:hypothetical protein